MQSQAHSIPLTRHARIRMQQRCIPQDAISFVVDFGDRRSAGRGMESCFFSKRSWQKAIRQVGVSAKRLERWRNIYIILGGDGAVVTAAWRH